MDFEAALARVQKIAWRIEQEDAPSLSESMREEARADRVALEIITEWAMKVYKTDKTQAAQMLNALHI